MTALSRREFLATLGAAGVAAAGSGWFVDRLFAMTREGALRAPLGAGVERWVPTLCRLCPAGCGIRVRLVDGLPVGIEGLRTNPVSAGGMCPAGLAGLQELVHPDRLQTPLRRDGPRGSGRWTRISWDEALHQIAEPLGRLRSQGRAQAFAVLERGDSPLTRRWLEQVMEAYGSPNVVLDGSNETWRAAWACVAGVHRAPAADLAGSDFILSFGHELFETDGHPVWQSKVWGRGRSPSAQRPVALAYVGPRISPSATRADLRVAIAPGQEAVMALGLAHVLMMENLIDRAFLDRWTSGYLAPAGSGPGTATGFEDMVRRKYTPEEVSRRTGVLVSDIYRLGRAFGSARRPVALVGPGPLRGESGMAAAMSVVALNLAVGAVGRAGGYVVGGGAPLTLPGAPAPRSAEHAPVPRPGDTGASRAGARAHAAQRVDGAGASTLGVVEQSPARLVDRAAGPRYPLEVLLIHGVNPMHEWAGGKEVERWLDQCGLVVVMAPIADETAERADLLLPEASFLESWGLLPATGSVPFDYAGLQQPVVEPLYESRSFEDAWFALARRLGGPMASAVPAGGFAEWLPAAAAGLFASSRGTLASGVTQGRIADFMESRGWKVAGPATAEAFWAGLKEAGAWVDAPRAEHSPEELLGPGFSRFEFIPERLTRDVVAFPDKGASGVAEAAETIYGGGPAPGAAEGRAYPLRLLLFDTNTLWGGRTARTPLMLELSGHREDIAWDSWVEIHPDTARPHGLADGDRVRIESLAGAVVARARLAHVVPRDAVAMPRGLGHRRFGRFASGVGADPMPLLPARAARWTGAPVHAAWVRIVARQA